MVETILVAITDTSDVRCLDLRLINKAPTLYCLSVTFEDLNL